MEESSVKKTPAFHPPLKMNEILVSRKKPRVVYLKRVHELFFGLGQKEVILQGIGAAVQMTVDLALSVQESYAGITFETVNTFTMPLRDIKEDGSDQVRFNSGICIKLLKD